MKGLMGAVLKNAVLIFVLVTIMARFPYVLSFDVVQITPLGGRTLQVKGVVEFQRNSDGWLGPENLYWFNLWWQNTEAADLVASESRGLIQLHSITWTLIEEKANSDVLEFTAVITVFPSASPPWRKGW
jgi:hypothetical protein